MTTPRDRYNELLDKLATKYSKASLEELKFLHHTCTTISDTLPEFHKIIYGIGLDIFLTKILEIHQKSPPQT